MPSLKSLRELTVEVPVTHGPITITLQAALERITPQDDTYRKLIERRIELDAAVADEQRKISEALRAIGEIMEPTESAFMAFRQESLDGLVAISAASEGEGDVTAAVGKALDSLENFSQTILPNDETIESRKQAYNRKAKAAAKKMEELAKDYQLNTAERIAHLCPAWDLTEDDGTMCPVTSKLILTFSDELREAMLAAIEKKVLPGSRPTAPDSTS